MGVGPDAACGGVSGGGDSCAHSTAAVTRASAIETGARCLENLTAKLHTKQIKFSRPAAGGAGRHCSGEEERRPRKCSTVGGGASLVMAGASYQPSLTLANVRVTFRLRTSVAKATRRQAALASPRSHGPAALHGRRLTAFESR